MLALTAVVVVLAGCTTGARVPEKSALAGLTFTAPAGPLPVVVRDHTRTEVTVASTARILPVNGDLVEVVYALGLGDSVVARDLSATYPPEVEELPVVGYQRALEPEPIAAFEPTVVLANTLAGPPGAVEQFRAIAPTVVLDYEDTVDGPSRLPNLRPRPRLRPHRAPLVPRAPPPMAPNPVPTPTSTPSRAPGRRCSRQLGFTTAGEFR